MATWKKVMGNGDWPLYTDKEEKSPQFGRFCIRPLQRGIGAIVGKLLAASFAENLAGAAVSALRFRFHREPGVNTSRESIVFRQICDSLEKLRLVSAGRFPLTGAVKKRGPCIVLPSDLTFSTPVQITSSSPALASLEAGETLELNFVVQWGRGKVTSEHSSERALPQGWVSLSRSHSPVRHIKIDIAQVEVGANQGDEQLIVEVTTDGSLSPEDAIRRAGTQVKLHH